MSTSEMLSVNKYLKGFVKVWKHDPHTGESFLVVDKPNMILKGGAKLLTHSLAGDSSFKIWGMYIGYNNSPSFTKPEITVDYGNPFGGFTAPFGYLREPLTFSPNYLSSEGYEQNTVLFSTMITSASAAGGANFEDGVSQIYEVALVAAPDEGDPTKDIVFSRTNFNSIVYNDSYNFTITWGVRILVA